jgi:t-SNARE complex subunit (syntaxin)
MDREVVKILNSEYDNINSTIIDIEQQLVPFEEIFNNTHFTYDQSNKKDIDEQFKSILIKTKTTNKTIKEYDNKIIKNTDENLKRIFISRIKILKQKYATLLRRIVAVNEKYNLYNKNLNKYSFIKNDELMEHEPVTNSYNSSAISKDVGESKDQVMISVRTTANDKATDVYRDTISRNTEVEQLARDIRELFTMFQDFSVLIGAQHEEIISIENTIEDTHTKVESGNKKIVEAIEYQRKARKKTCCIALGCVLILIIIISIGGGISTQFI